MISKENIYFDVEVKTKKELLRWMFENLHKEGYVKASYLDAVLEREERSPTGLPTMPFQIAIPHTDVEHVIKPCIMVVRPKEKITFKEMGNPDSSVEASYVFGLVFKEGARQTKLLASIMEMVTNNDDMNKLITAETKSEVYGVLSKYLD